MAEQPFQCGRHLLQKPANLLKKSLTIQINEPCREDWSKMTATEKGAFCHSCNKEVMDFTHRTNYQIYHALNGRKDVCGRFFKHQLEKPITVAEPSPFAGFRLAATALISFLTLYKVQAASPDQAYVPRDTTYQRDSGTTILMGDTFVPTRTPMQISGRIYDRDNNLPLANAFVKLIGTGISAETDSTGFFLIDTSIVKMDSPAVNRLLVKCIGYKSQYVKLESTSDFVSIGLAADQITFEIQTVTMGFTVMPSADEYDFQNSVRNIFYKKDDNYGGSPGISQRDQYPQKKKRFPALPEPLVAWIDSRRKLINGWIKA
jgi:hypothetical protein